MCQEDTCETVCVTRIAGVFKNSNAFCMPACNAQVTVVFDNIGDLPIGAWFWAYGIGVLKIVSYNTETSEVVLENICPSDPCGTQAAPGTPIPACTVFVLTVPTCPGGIASPGTLYPFLASGFTAPAIGDCIDVSVTNVNGLAVNKNVSINGGVYRLSAILSGTLITICNDGSGLTPGTIVDYLDGNGNYIVPVILIDANPCTNNDILTGVVLACDGSDIASPLVGSQNGQVLVWDSVTETASFRTLGIPVIDCTSLTVCLTLDPTNPPGTSYLVQVQDTSDFQAGDIVTILGREFIVDSVDSGTQMHITPLEGVYVVENYPAGSQLCSADCCTMLENNQSSCGQWLDANANYHDADALAQPVVIELHNDTVNGNQADFSVINNSCKFPMGVHIVWDFVWQFSLFGADQDYQDLEAIAEIYAGTNPAMPLATIYNLANVHIVRGSQQSNQNRFSDAATFSSVVTINPGQTLYIAGRGSMHWLHPDGGIADHAEVSELSTRITCMGVAVRT